MDEINKLEESKLVINEDIRKQTSDKSTLEEEIQSVENVIRQHENREQKD